MHGTGRLLGADLLVLAGTITAPGVAGVWPPLTTTGKPTIGKGVDKSLLGTIARGSERQVTYDGHPLYTDAGDGGAGQVDGEGISASAASGPSFRSRGSP